MKISAVIAATFCFAFALEAALFQRRPSGPLQLVALFTTFLFLAALLYGVWSLLRLAFTPKELRKWRLVAPVACILAFISFQTVGHRWNRYEFERALPAMNAVISELQTRPPGFLNSKKGQILIPPTLRRMVQVIHSDQTEDGQLRVSFIYGGGFPAKHSGWYYSSVDSPPGRDEGWTKYRKILDNWYKIGD